MKINLVRLADICTASSNPLESVINGALILEKVELNNTPATVEEFKLFLFEITNITNDSTKRIIMHICGELVRFLGIRWEE